jgi:transposase
VQAVRKTGTSEAKPQGGDRRSKRIEAHHTFIMEAIADRKDVTLAELQALLVKRRRARFGIGTLWRFFDRHGITVKKRRRMPTNSNGPTSKENAEPGSRTSRS